MGVIEMVRDLSALAYPLKTLVFEYNLYARNSLEYALFNQGLLEGLKRDAATSKVPAYVKGYQVGKSY